MRHLVTCVVWDEADVPVRRDAVRFGGGSRKVSLRARGDDRYVKASDSAYAIEQQLERLLNPV